MTTPSNPTTLTPREAVADALYRCLFGIDSNDRELWESSFLKTEEVAFIADPVIKLEGWTAVSEYFQRAFSVITTHITSNVRVELKGPDTASLTCQTVSYHVRPENAFIAEETSYTGYTLYYIDLVKDEGDGSWKIKRWNVKILRTTGDPAVVHG